jgi:hypothetical protein
MGKRVEVAARAGKSDGARRAEEKVPPVHHGVGGDNLPVAEDPSERYR